MRPKSRMFPAALEGLSMLLPESERWKRVFAQNGDYVGKVTSFSFHGEDNERLSFGRGCSCCA